MEVGRVIRVNQPGRDTDPRLPASRPQIKKTKCVAKPMPRASLRNRSFYVLSGRTEKQEQWPKLLTQQTEKQRRRATARDKFLPRFLCSGRPKIKMQRKLGEARPGHPLCNPFFLLICRLVGEGEARPGMGRGGTGGGYHRLARPTRLTGGSARLDRAGRPYQMYAYLAA